MGDHGHGHDHAHGAHPRPSPEQMREMAAQMEQMRAQNPQAMAQMQAMAGQMEALKAQVPGGKLMSHLVGIPTPEGTRPRAHLAAGLSTRLPFSPPAPLPLSRAGDEVPQEHTIKVPPVRQYSTSPQRPTSGRRPHAGRGHAHHHAAQLRRRHGMCAPVYHHKCPILLTETRLCAGPMWCARAAQPHHLTGEEPFELTPQQVVTPCSVFCGVCASAGWAPLRWCCWLPLPRSNRPPPALTAALMARRARHLPATAPQ
eukprot:COSAG01_NODE_8014_length_2953_cov_14.818851_6_plen_257_part_00